MHSKGIIIFQLDTKPSFGISINLIHKLKQWARFQQLYTNFTFDMDKSIKKLVCTNLTIS